MTRRRDPHTIDLFDWNPPTIVERYDDRAINAVSWRDRVARAVAQTLKSCALPRAEIAETMSEWLGEEISVAMLDAYASQAKEAHTIPFMRVMALCVACGDHRILQLAADQMGRAIVDERYLGAIDEAMAAEQIEKLERIRRNGRRQWKGRR